MSKRYQGGVLGVGFNPLQAPNAPTIGAATAGNTTVSVAFTAPANVGGSAISTYAVRVSPGNVSATGSSSPISVTGLTNGTTYTFSVAALNSYGPSPYSGTVTAAPVEPTYVEDVFSTYLYTGANVAQTITNGIDLSGQGGMVWLKGRSNAQTHGLWDTSRGASQWISTSFTTGQSSLSGLNLFNNNGFRVGTDADFNNLNYTYASWTFRKASKFFDVVTWTGNGSGSRNISHSLGITPGFIMYKKTSDTAGWSVAANQGGNMACWQENAFTTSLRSDIQPTSNFCNATTFQVGSGQWPGLNESGQTYVAYLFANDTASDGIIQCAAYTGNGSSSGPTVTLGWEPQWLMIKNVSTSGTDWVLLDNMRGIPVGANDARLLANASDAETTSGNDVSPTPTGFQLTTTSPSINTNGNTYVYIAIRRGPMKTPTVGTSVFNTVVRTGTGVAATVSTGNTPDWIILKNRSGSDGNNYSRLTGRNRQLYTNQTFQEVDQGTNYGVTGFLNSAFTLGLNANNENQTGASIANWVFSRAPSFFDEVCYTGNDASPQTLNHNLGVTPELMIVKQRNTSSPWTVYAASQGLNTGYLNRGDLGFGNNSNWGTAPTSTTFSVQGSSQNASGGTFVAYLFASCPGVSKVGSYTGTGTTQTINCGFTTGSRFVLIKRTDSTGDWYVWDSARGIVAGNDPYLLLNDGAAEVTNTDYIDTDNSGFQISSTAPAAINANGGTFIYLAIS